MGLTEEGLDDVWGSDFVQKNPNKAYKVSYASEYTAVGNYLSGGAEPNFANFSKLGRGLCKIEKERRAGEVVIPPEPPPTTISISQNISAGQTLSGTKQWTATVNDPALVDEVRFSIDGQLKHTEQTAPYNYLSGLDTTSLANGNHTFKVEAVALAGGNNAGSTVQATVTNVVVTPPPATGAYKLEHFSDFKNNSFPPYIFYNRWSQGTNNYTGPGDVKPAWPSINPEPAIQEISTPHGPGFRIRCNPEMVQPAGGKIVNIEDFDHLVPDNDLIGQTQEWTFMWMFPAAGNPQQFPRNWSDSNTIFEFHDTWHPLLIGIDTTGTKQHLYVTSSAMTNGSYPRKRGEAPDPIQFDRWYHMRFQIKFSHDTSGFVKAWHDNVQIADLHGQSVVSSASGAYVILGFYSMGIEKRNEIHYAQVTQRVL